MIRYGSRTALAGVVLAGGLMISGTAYAQSSAYAQGSSRDPVACTDSCRKDHDNCLAQMGTQEMCGVDQRICRKQCEAK
jgi:predicted transglutaminase-like cysteine proteinase